MKRWDGPPDSWYDPPDDPPMIECPDCDEFNQVEVEGQTITCPRCKGYNETYATEEEIRDAAGEAAIERAEARRDGDL